MGDFAGVYVKRHENRQVTGERFGITVNTGYAGSPCASVVPILNIVQEEANMAKILILSNAIGGLYNFRRELICEMLDMGYEVYISTPVGDRAPYFIELGCHFIETNFNRRGLNLFQDLKLLRTYFRLIMEVAPAVVLTYTVKPNIYGGLACRWSNTPYLTNVTGLGSAVGKKGVLQKLLLLLYRAALKQASCVFFQNKANRQFFLQQGVVSGRERLIPGSGVNLNYFNLMAYPSEDVLHFLFIGRVMKEKGIEEYLEILNRIRVRYKNTVFHIVGPADEVYEPKLVKLHHQGVVCYHGRQEDVRPFLQMSHCTVHPTYYPEGMSNVLLESAACGRPVITTDRSGCREAVEDGVTGFLVPHQDVVALARAVEKFIRLPNEEKRRMGLAGRAKVEREFNRQVVIDAYMEEINHVKQRKQR